MKQSCSTQMGLSQKLLKKPFFDGWDHNFPICSFSCTVFSNFWTNPNWHIGKGQHEFSNTNGIFKMIAFLPWRKWRVPHVPWVLVRMKQRQLPTRYQVICFASGLQLQLLHTLRNSISCGPLCHGQEPTSLTHGQWGSGCWPVPSCPVPLCQYVPMCHLQLNLLKSFEQVIIEIPTQSRWYSAPTI